MVEKYSGDGVSRAAPALPSSPEYPQQRRQRPPAQFAFSSDRRLRKASEFQAVRNSGKSWAHPLLVLRSRPNGLAVTRFGFSVAKRIGKAVVRNKVKRRLRECVRQAPVKGGWDVVFIARQPAAQATYQELVRDALELLGRAGLLTKDEREHR